MQKILLIILFVLLNFFGFSQLTDYFDIMREEFNEEKQNEITEIEKNIIQADKIRNSAKEMINSGDTVKSLSLFKKATDIYAPNYRSLFLLFEEILNEKTEELSGNKSDYVKQLLDDAKNCLRISIARRHLAHKEKDKLLAYEFYKASHEKEQEAIHLQSHSYGIIINDIDEDMAVDKIDYSEKIEFDNFITDNFESRTFTVYNPSVKQNLTYHKVKDDSSLFSDRNSDVNYYTENSEHNSSNRRKYYRITKKENGREYHGYLFVETDNEKTLYKSEGQTYRIQIGTSILPANQIQIDRLNKSDLKVHTYKSDLYYKYTIGNFSTFKEAKNYKHAFGLKNTYIVEYLDGKEKRLYLRDYQ